MPFVSQHQLIFAAHDVVSISKVLFLYDFTCLTFRRKLRLYCPMNLRKFPMDEQLCEMTFESCKYACN